MFAPLPPSSNDTRFKVSAAAFEIAIPARVDPVKEIISTSGCTESCEPTPTPSPFTRLNTPAGTPAASTISANRRDDRGAISDGFSTIVQPVISAGIAFRVTWFIGQFHGVIMPTTPIGSLMIRVPALPFRRCSHSKPWTALRKPRMCQSPELTCSSREKSIGAPISRLMAFAMSCWRSV